MKWFESVPGSATKRRFAKEVMSSPTAIPITRHKVDPDRVSAIRQAVRGVKVGPRGPEQRIAQPEEAAAFQSFLQDPRVHAAIYSLPRPLTDTSVRDFIAHYQEAQVRGEGLLLLTWDEHGHVASYSSLEVWPQWGAGELTGALHPDRQSRGSGVAGAAETFEWMFETLKLDLICATGALNNQRTARMLDGLGFDRVGEIVSQRPDGTTRPSRVWEITHQAWRSDAAHRNEQLTGRSAS